MKKYFIIFMGLALASCGNNSITIDENPIIEENTNNGNNGDDDDNLPLSPRRYIELSEPEMEITGSQLDFACNFLKVAMIDNGQINFVISPLSAYFDLSMVANGASGETASEIAKVLLKEHMTLNEVNEFNKRLESELSTMDNWAMLKLSNSIWYSDKFPIKPFFLNVNKEYYNALSTSLDFTKNESFDIMNKWLSEATKGLIKEFKIPENPEFVLANALYFKAKWFNPFDSEDTEDADFYNADGSVSTVKMMKGIEYQYSEPAQGDGKFVIIQIPYGNRAYSFYAAFSGYDSDKSLDGIENVITAENINSAIHGANGYGGGYIKFPRFEVSSAGDITKEMQLLGIKSLFCDADLTGVTDSKVKQLSIFQETNLKVEEAGTVGTSATYMRVTTADLDSKPQTPRSFTVNRPFVFWIMENSSRSVVFMGRINKL